ncbi:hypothetical protein N7G274_002206 [Stereocaulon virgatum]|uniref:Secreted protein n=1 Tax=Stereocaulon virgatum TaxID=373712 RepID=A0ABR4AJZ3_9LECA
MSRLESVYLIAVLTTQSTILPKAVSFKYVPQETRSSLNWQRPDAPHYNVNIFCRAQEQGVSCTSLWLIIPLANSSVCTDPYVQYITCTLSASFYQPALDSAKYHSYIFVSLRISS